MVNHDLVEHAKDFEILYDVGVLVCDEDQEQLVDRHEYISDDIGLNVGGLATRLDEFGEIGHVLLHLEAADGHELARDQNLSRLAADACTYHSDVA